MSALMRFESAVKHSLNGLKVACYYGCLLVRPPEVVKFDDPENPTSLDRLVKAMGGESLDWPHKVECCGGGLVAFEDGCGGSTYRFDSGYGRTASARIASRSAARCARVNLDLRQQDIKKQTGRNYQMPIVYITQLLGLSLGIGPDELGFKKLMVPASAVLEKVEVNSHG